MFISGLPGFWREAGASAVLTKLFAIINTKAMVMREGREAGVLLEDFVTVDIVLLNACDIIPCDGLITGSNMLFVDERR